MKTVKEASKSLEFNRGLIQSNPKLMITESFNSGVEFAQRWIPVSEKLPEDGALIFTKGGDDPIDIDICWFKNRKFIMRFAYQPSYYSNTYKFREDITESTTHWKPIEYK